MERGRGHAVGVSVQLLGRVRAWAGSREIDLGSGRRRTLFAMLAMRAGQVVSQDEIVDGLWADAAPGNPTASIYTYINGLRRALEPERGSRSSSSVLESASPGYRLCSDGVEVDAVGFAAHVSAGRALLASDPGAAMAQFNAALVRWHGTPLEGASGPFAQVARLRLVESRFGLVEDRAQALLMLGDHSVAITALRGLVGDYPWRERPRGLLMQALYRGGWAREALEVFDDVEAVLGAELGIEPGSFLRRLRDRIDVGDPALLAGPLEQADQPVPVVADVPAQLPRAVSTFTGRRAELERLRAWLTPTAHGSSAEVPVTGVISGPAGVGKTTLAVRIAHELSEYFPDGQLFVNLRGFDPHRPPVNASQALAKLLSDLEDQVSIPRESEAELGAHFRSVLSGKRVLLVLDNALSSEQIRSLLPGSSCAVLVTSRNRLDGLVARDGAQVVDLHPWQPAESSVFLTRLVGPKRTTGEEEDLHRISDLCGHLPLALDIVARRLMAQSALRPGDVVAQLSDESDRLNALASDDEGLRSVFSWSYQALKPEPAQLFRRLGLYPCDRISVGAAAALNGASTAETHRLLEVLTNSHLLDWAGRGSYQIHNLLHLYTKELVDDEVTSGERDAAVRRMFDWYMYSASNANRLLEPEQIRRRLPLESPPESCRPLEFADSEAAAGWVVEESARVVSVVRYAAELGYDEYVWKIVSAGAMLTPLGPRINEWIKLKELAVAAAKRQGDDYAEMWSTTALGYGYVFAGRLTQALECFSSGTRYWRTAGADRPGARLLEEGSLSGSAFAFRLAGELENALKCCYQALAIAQEEGESNSEVWILGIIGILYCDQGRLEEAEALLREALIKRPANDRTQLLIDNNLFSFMGQVKQKLGRFEEAAVYLNQALAAVRRMNNNPLGEIRILLDLSQVRQDLGQVDEANKCEQLAADLMAKFDIPAAAMGG